MGRGVGGSIKVVRMTTGYGKGGEVHARCRGAWCVGVSLYFGGCAISSSTHFLNLMKKLYILYIVTLIRERSENQ